MLIYSLVMDDSEILHDRAHAAVFDMEYLFVNKKQPLTWEDICILEAARDMLLSKQ